MVYEDCLDVMLVDKPYFIRFTDVLDTKYWDIIKDKNNFSKPIQIKFQSKLLRGKILYNPNEVSIDYKVIVPARLEEKLYRLVHPFTFSL